MIFSPKALAVSLTHIETQARIVGQFEEIVAHLAEVADLREEPTTSMINHERYTSNVRPKDGQSSRHCFQHSKGKGVSVCWCEEDMGVSEHLPFGLSGHNAAEVHVGFQSTSFDEPTYPVGLFV